MTQINRRTLAKGAAWTAPVIVVAAQAPAFAASYPPITLTLIGGEKCPGNSTNFNNKTYIFEFEADAAPAQGSITAAKITAGGVEYAVKRVTIIGTKVYFVTESTNSANLTGTVSFTYTSGMPQVEKQFSAQYPATPPDHGLCGRSDI